MTPDLILALALFAFVSSITPGPNNLMLMASGANYGFRRTIPHMLGVSLGFVFMFLALGAGLQRVFNVFPLLNTLLKYGSIVFLLYLAWKIAHSAPIRENDATGAPFSFLQAAAFQWVNPKAWTMALIALNTYVPTHSMTAVAIAAVLFGAVNLPSVSSWVFLGQKMTRVLTNPARMTAFNWTMAALLVASLYPALQS